MTKSRLSLKIIAGLAAGVAYIAVKPAAQASRANGSAGMDSYAENNYTINKLLKYKITVHLIPDYTATN
ncbi:MAG: hypothetical protein ABIN95_13175 [Mucilaginibacter sp.]